MKKINSKHEEQIIDDALDEFIKISISNLGEILEKVEKKIENLNQINLYKNILINFAGNALFKIVRQDKGIKPYARNAEYFMEHMDKWFKDAIGELNDKYADDSECPHIAEVE
jgi:conjugal transfer/entry exclusion protein